MKTASFAVEILVSGKGPTSFDAGRAAQNMLLAAWNEGLLSTPNGIADPELAHGVLEAGEGGSGRDRARSGHRGGHAAPSGCQPRGGARGRTASRSTRSCGVSVSRGLRGTRADRSTANFTDPDSWRPPMWRAPSATTMTTSLAEEVDMSALEVRTPLAERESPRTAPRWYTTSRSHHSRSRTCHAERSGPSRSSSVSGRRGALPHRHPRSPRRLARQAVASVHPGARGRRHRRRTRGRT